MRKLDKTETLVTIGDMTYVREVTKLTCIVVSSYISSLAQFGYFLSLFELVSLLSKAPVTLRQRPQRPYYVLKTWQTQWEWDEMQEKNTVFKFVQRPCYAPARMSLRLTRPATFCRGNKTIHRQDNSSTRFLETIHQHNRRLVINTFWRQFIDTFVWIYM